MKEVTREKTITEVEYYESVDGMHFHSKEECEKYERSARVVLFKELEPYHKGKITEYDLYNGIGSEEYDVDIYYILDADILHKLNIYRTMLDKSAKLIEDKYIGKNILLSWDYDHTCSYIEGTIDDVLAKIRGAYNKAIEPKEEEKEN